MKILAISDLHLDLESNYFSEYPKYTSRDYIKNLLDIKDFDVLVIAGDIANNNRISFMFIRSLCGVFKDKQILFVPGNHDFYNRLGYYKEINKVKTKFESFKNFHLLYNDQLVIDDYRFIGSTLWTDMEYSSVDGMNLIRNKKVSQRYMNDYYKILKDDRKPLTVEDTIKENSKCFDAIKGFVSIPDAKKCVIITHHAPSPLSIPGCYMNNDMNCAYVNNHNEYIRENSNKIKLWIHGHIHSYNDYQIGNTRIFSNPFGYDGERIGFEFKIIEV